MKRLTTAAAVLALTLLLGVLNVGSASAATITASSLLTKLGVASESGSASYDRSYFKHWVDADGDCQDTHAEVLVAERKAAVTYTSSRRCAVAKGSWYSFYDGATWTAPADVDIDHMVPLKEAWESGARAWSVDNRTRYANDLGFSASLVAVTDNVNQSKGDRDPAAWLPPRAAARCTYATYWVQVKYRWRLRVDSAEKAALAAILKGECGSRSVLLPVRAL